MDSEETLVEPRLGACENIGTVDASQGDSATNGRDFSGGGGTLCDVFYAGDLSQAGTFTPQGICDTASAAGPPGVIPLETAEGRDRKLKS